MSSISFHTASGDEVRVRGPERALAGVTCMRLFVGQIDATDTRLAALFPAGHYMRNLAFGREYPAGLVFADRLATALSVGNGLLTLPDGRQDDAFTISLNTAVLLGNDSVRFLARLHGQCEVHGWVAGHNRAWLAEIIEDARASEILRPDMGWEAVINLLKASDQGEVVTSYSVCESFPSPTMAGIELSDDEDDPWEIFAALSREEQWSRSMSAIRHGGLEWSPDNWGSIRFGAGITALDVSRARWPTARFETGAVGTQSQGDGVNK